MPRNRKHVGENDPMELLLDTVSNVFGGVMFLTLLAALLVINRGGAAIADKTTVDPSLPTDYNRQQQMLSLQKTELEIESLDFSIRQQQAMLTDLDPDGDAAIKADRLKSLRVEVADAQRDVLRLQQREQTQGETLRQSIANRNAMKLENEQLVQAVAQRTAELAQLQDASQRSIEFRQLRPSVKPEATLMLRYGRIYRLRENPNSDAFYPTDINVRKILGTTTVAPRRDGGQAATAESLRSTVKLLIKNFPPRRFNVAVAVWDDSFDKFNDLKNALIDAQYEYRTLPSTDDTVLSMGDVNGLVQ